MTGAEILAFFKVVATGATGSAVYDAIKNTKSLLPITDDRRKAIEKTWSGSFLQESPDSTFEKFYVSFSIKAKRKHIIGIGEYSGENIKTTIELIGGFYRDDYLYINYRNNDKAVFQHGLMILHWPNNPTTLTGNFVGIGRSTNGIVSGKIELNA